MIEFVLPPAFLMILGALLIGVSRPALLGTSRVPSFMFIEPLLSTTQKRTGNATVLSISSLESPRGKPRPAIARHAASSLPGQSLVPAGGTLVG